MIPVLERGWPLTHEGADPWAGDEWLPDLPSDHADHLRYAAKPVSEARYRELDRTFLRVFFEVQRGAATQADLLPYADVLGVAEPVVHDEHLPLIAPERFAESILHDVVENLLPDAVPLCADRVLGPWVDEDPSLELRRAAVATMAWTGQLRSGASPVRRWARDKGARKTRSLRASIVAAGRAAPMLWTVGADGLWTAELPLRAGATPITAPHGPLAVLEPDRPVVAVLARVVPVADGSWQACGAVGLARLPPVRALQRRLELALWRERRHGRNITWEGLLRARPEVLYRFSATWCWLRRAEEDPCLP